MSFSKQIFSLSAFAVLAVGLAACTSGIASSANKSAIVPAYPLGAYEPELEIDVIVPVVALDKDPASAQKIWTLRAALNVAALSCGSAPLAASYNQMLTTHKSALSEAYAAELARYRMLHGGRNQTLHDRDLTRTYNYFANIDDRRSFCANAETVLAQASVVPSPLFSRFVRGALVRLDRQAAEAVFAAR